MIKLIKRTWVRLFLLAVLAIVGLTLGYMRWTYVLLWDQGFNVQKRHEIVKEFSYPDNWESLVTSLKEDPRWLSLIFYSVVPLLLSLAAVYLTFLKKEYVFNTLVVYSLAWGLVVLLSIISLVYPSYTIGIGLAQNVKNLIQMPFFTLLLLAGFKMSEKLAGRNK